MRAILLYYLIVRQNGRLAQLVERLPYKQDVISSSLVLPIIKKLPLGSFFALGTPWD